jgi:hypothetical protein
MVKLTLNINHFKNMIFLSLKYLLDIDRTLDLLRNLFKRLKKKYSTPLRTWK